MVSLESWQEGLNERQRAVEEKRKKEEWCHQVAK